MNEQFIRSAMLYGEQLEDCLKNKTVCIFGVGGVGGYVCEGLARIGVGHLILVDHDKVSLSNLNRQIIALINNFWLSMCLFRKFSECCWVDIMFVQ